MSGPVLRLGTRKSPMALAQSGRVAGLITAATGRPVELVGLTSFGDVTRVQPRGIGGTGVFVSALRDSLLHGVVDVAVHSLKEWPGGSPADGPAPGIPAAGSVMAIARQVAGSPMVAAMDQLTIRQTSAELPRFDAEAALEPVSLPGARSRLVTDFQCTNTAVDTWELANAQLLRGKICRLRTGTASITGTRMESVEFTGCDLSSLRWQDGKLSRVRFDACRFLAARFQAVTMEHVLFTGCRLDYAMLDQIRAAGPVLFAGCSLREAELTGCSLAGAALDGCDLRLTSFGLGSYWRCDLRGNDLSALIGAACLKRVIIDQAQTVQLGEALAAELKVTFGDELSNRP